MTNNELWDYGVRFTGQMADETPSSSEWNTRGPREWRRPGGAVLEGERRRPVANSSRDEPIPVDAPIRHGRAESRKRHRPVAGGGAPDEYPAPTDVEASVGPIRKQARIVGETSNGPLVEGSAPDEWAQIYDAFLEAPEIGPQEAVHHQEMMATFAPKSDAYLTQVARWEKHDRERQYYPRIPSKVQSGVSLPFFCLDAVQRYSAWLLIDLFHMVIFNFGGFVFVSYRGGPYY